MTTVGIGILCLTAVVLGSLKLAHNVLSNERLMDLGAPPREPPAAHHCIECKYSSVWADQRRDGVIAGNEHYRCQVQMEEKTGLPSMCAKVNPKNDCPFYKPKKAA